jgi:ankyrin repeat protein
MEVNHRNTHGQTPLYLACEGGHEDVLRVLLQVEGAELSTGSARTPLSAAAKSGHLSIVMMLLAHPNVDVNGVGKDGCTALWHASANGHQVVVQCLLSQTEVDVNKASPHGTPLIQVRVPVR